MRRNILFLGCITLLLAGIARGANGSKLTVRVIDADTGEVLPARLAIKASDGSYPGDRLCLSAKDWPGIDGHAVFVAGEETIELPAGATSIIAAHGPQYGIDAKTMDLKSDIPAKIELKLHRVIDLKKLGWVGGDAHLHMIHGEMIRQTSYEDVATTCRANGLDWASANQEYVGAGKLDLPGYHAECEKVSTKDFRLLFGGERPKSLLGHNVLINVSNPFVIPDDPPYYAAARKIHAEGGVLFPVHPTRYFPDKKYQNKWLDFPGNNLGREIVFDALLGPSFDALSVLSDEPSSGTTHNLWFNLLNRGLFVPAAADSDACFDRPEFGFHAPGFWITYVNVGAGNAVTGESLADGIRNGRTFATTGPLVLFDVDGKLSGSTVAPDGARHAIHIRATHPNHLWSLSEKDPSGKPMGISKVELIRDGKVVKAWEPNTTEATLEHSVKESEPCWYAVRVYGSDKQWQVAMASPVYFAKEPVPQKRTAVASTVRGKIYDFKTGEPRKGTVEVRQGESVLKRFEADGQFWVKMPLDAELTVSAEGERPITKRVLQDLPALHHFLWYLTSADLGKAETLDKVEGIAREVEFEFPLGQRMPGCYAATELKAGMVFDEIKVKDGPAAPKSPTGSIALAALMIDKESVAPGEVIHVAGLFRYEGDKSEAPDMRLVIEGRAYEAIHPKEFEPFKLFAGVEENWSKSKVLAGGYRMIAGELKVPDWADPGPIGEIEINVRTRGGGPVRDGAFVGIRIPLAKRSRNTLMLCTPWPTMPLSWPDHNYGVGPLKICAKGDRSAQCAADYRKLNLVFNGKLDLLPARDAIGCPDSDDAIFTGQFFDQVLNDESHFATPDSVRPQPKTQWKQMPIIDATGIGAKN